MDGQVMKNPVFLTDSKGVYLAIQLKSNQLILLDIFDACFDGKHSRIDLDINDLGAINFLSISNENMFIGYNKPDKAKLERGREKQKPGLFSKLAKGVE